MEVTISCCFCNNTHEHKIDLPVGWESINNFRDIEDVFCPKHSIILKFVESQCPGCVGGWMDCTLWNSFAYSKPTLTEADFKIISNGICPKRINGMMLFDHNTREISELDWRYTKNIEAGEALVRAIKEYWEE